MTDFDRSASAPSQNERARKEGNKVPGSVPEAQADTKPVNMNPANSEPANNEQNSAVTRKKRRTKNSRNPFRQRRQSHTFAALDLGTNNCRLLVARQHEGGFRIIDGFSRIVRLGEGVSQTGRLDEAAIERTMEALAQCAEKLTRHQPTSIRLIATQACRAADNSGEFLDRVRKELGLDLEIVDQRTEAELAVTGCGDLIAKDAKGALMFDIGGGSSELAWLDFRGGRPKARGKMSASIRSWQSLPVGVVSIAEKFGGRDVTKDSFEEMVGFVSEKLKSFKGSARLKDMIEEHPVHLIGTSGTVTTLAGLHLGLERYDRSKVDGLWMRDEEVVDTMRVLLSMPYERRAAHQCIGADRADLVLPGCAIFEAIRREWTTKRIRVADRGLREGILISLMDADRGGRPRKRSRRKPSNKQGNE